MSALLGRKLGRYRLLEQLGSGGMSVVYKGLDSALEREVAVKVLHPHLAEKPESRRRLAREAKAVARLHHPNIVEVFDFSEADSADAQAKATQLQAALAAAGLPQPSTQVLTTLYGVDGGVSCQNVGDLLHTDGLALFGNPSHSRRVPLDPKVAAFDQAVISTYCPDLLPALQKTQSEQTTPQQTIG